MPMVGGKKYSYSKKGMAAAKKAAKKSGKKGTKGGKAGQWSARKAQLLANEYKKAGGGYK